MLQDLHLPLQQKGTRPAAMRLLALDFLLSQPTAVRLDKLKASLLRPDRIAPYRTHILGQPYPVGHPWTTKSFRQYQNRYNLH